MYGGWQIGNLSAAGLRQEGAGLRLVMKRTDPRIELVGCGQNGWSDWDEVVLDGLAELVDFHSIHLYTGCADHYATVFQSHQAERAIRICAALIERVRHASGSPTPSGSPSTSGTCGTGRGATRTGWAGSRSGTP